MNMTAERLLELGVADMVIPEPLGGAHRDLVDMSGRIKSVLSDELSKLQRLTVDQLLAQRYKKLRHAGMP
jgi:acetyl-CoA carboxylase carboxyl transferase subunit alpha